MSQPPIFLPKEHLAFQIFPHVTILCCNKFLLILHSNVSSLFVVCDTFVTCISKYHSLYQAGLHWLSEWPVMVSWCGASYA